MELHKGHESPRNIVEFLRKKRFAQVAELGLGVVIFSMGSLVGMLTGILIALDGAKRLRNSEGKGLFGSKHSGGH